MAETSWVDLLWVMFGSGMFGYVIGRILHDPRHDTADECGYNRCDEYCRLVTEMNVIEEENREMAEKLGLHPTKHTLDQIRRVDVSVVRDPRSELLEPEGGE